MTENKQITWTAPEFVSYPKSRTRSAVVIAVGVILIGYFLWQKDFLTALMFLLLLGMLLYFSRMKPRQITITISARGVRLNEIVLPFAQIKSFWLVYEPPEVKILNFETTAYLNRFLTVQLADQDPMAVREYLLEFLPEDLDREERLSDRIARTLKF